MKNDSKKILIIEDESSFNYAMSLKLNSLQDVEIIYAEDGKKGLKLALEHKPDLIILDIVMPIMDGIEMLKLLRQDDWGKTANVLILSNLTDIHKEQTARELGVIDYIIKAESRLDEVIEKISKLLNS